MCPNYCYVGIRHIYLRLFKVTYIELKNPTWCERLSPKSIDNGPTSSPDQAQWSNQIKSKNEGPIPQILVEVGQSFELKQTPYLFWNP